MASLQDWGIYMGTLFHQVCKLSHSFSAISVGSTIQHGAGALRGAVALVNGIERMAFVSVSTSKGTPGGGRCVRDTMPGRANMLPKAAEFLIWIHEKASFRSKLRLSILGLR